VQRLASATVDQATIPWLPLQAKTTHGPGIFKQTTYVQRVNAAGGLAPSTIGTSMGQLALVQYSAEYFYRARWSAEMGRETSLHPSHPPYYPHLLSFHSLAVKTMSASERSLTLLLCDREKYEKCAWDVPGRRDDQDRVGSYSCRVLRWDS